MTPVAMATIVRVLRRAGLSNELLQRSQRSEVVTVFHLEEICYGRIRKGLANVGRLLASGGIAHDERVGGPGGSISEEMTAIRRILTGTGLMEELRGRIRRGEEVTALDILDMCRDRIKSEALSRPDQVIRSFGEWVSSQHPGRSVEVNEDQDASQNERVEGRNGGNEVDEENQLDELSNNEMREEVLQDRVQVDSEDDSQVDSDVPQADSDDDHLEEDSTNSSGSSPILMTPSLIGSPTRSDFSSSSGPLTGGNVLHSRSPSSSPMRERYSHSPELTVKVKCKPAIHHSSSEIRSPVYSRRSPLLSPSITSSPPPLLSHQAPAQQVHSSRGNSSSEKDEREDRELESEEDEDESDSNNSESLAQAPAVSHLRSNSSSSHNNHQERHFRGQSRSSEGSQVEESDSDDALSNNSMSTSSLPPPLRERLFPDEDEESEEGNLKSDSNTGSIVDNHEPALDSDSSEMAREEALRRRKAEKRRARRNQREAIRRKREYQRHFLMGNINFKPRVAPVERGSRAFRIDEGMFICSGCGKMFSHRSSCNRHFDGAHGDERRRNRFKCFTPCRYGTHRKDCIQSHFINNHVKK